MTTLDGLSPVTPEQAFEYSDLSMAGVELAPEQVQLLRDSLTATCAAVGVATVEDPQSLGGAPLVVAGTDGPTLQLVPMVFSLTPGDWNDVRLSPAALRFPSAAGRQVSWSCDIDDGDAQLVRLWNLWPIGAADADVVLDAVANWFEEYYTPLQLFYRAYDGLIAPCTAVTLALESPVREHNHGDNPAYPHCWDGEAWLLDFYDRHFDADPKGANVLRTLPPPELPADLAKVWEHLVNTSQVDSLRAMSAVPFWKRQEVAKQERLYSPWLWLS